MSVLELALVAVVTTAGAVVHGSIGIGLGLVAGPALIAIDPDFAPGPLLLAGQLIGARHAVIERAAIDRGACRRCLRGLPIGLVVGLLMLEMLSRRSLSIVIGLLVAGAAVVLLRGARIRRTTAVEVVSGAGTTFSSITAAMPGPPFVVAFSDLPPPELRATASAFFLMVAAAAFGVLVVSDNFGAREFELLGVLVPGVLVGLGVSRFVRPHLDRPWFRPLVLWIALAGGLALVVRQVV